MSASLPARAADMTEAIVAIFVLVYLGWSGLVFL